MINEAISWLKSQDSVYRVVPLEGGVRDAVFTEEESVGTRSGIVLDNEALRDARERSYCVALIPSRRGPLPFAEGFNSVLMKDSSDRVCGFQVHSEEERARIEENGGYVWLSDDFVLDASLDFTGIRFVLPSVPLRSLEEGTGARDAVIMFPSPSTVQLVLDLLAPDIPRTKSVFIVSFN